ncbi:FkbM family methyltransferase [Pseudomonas sp. REST10]|uniref:FkbM family methyltransferase n=1 Tax=Pseudomonas sp. REST10 TaxID=2512235 RepID=UPI00240E53FC|nr:FkbM family methyltransferase [Pseudomonas sp. REST10]WFC63186.1 FkbM family methyltransferase [Pseudomonas sp. REST10]
MEKTKHNRLLLAREGFKAGEIDKFQYGEWINQEHAGLFDYPEFLADTDVAEIRITAEGVSVSSASHDIAMLVDAVDLHATPYTLLDFGSYESDETAFLKSVLRDGEVFLDIGANLGWYSLALGRHCPTSRIYAFEPIPSTVEMLEKNIRLNRLGNIEVIRMGLFSQEDELNFLFAPDVSGATSLKLAGQSRGRASIQNVVCRTTTLDAFCASRDIVPALLKIDVEGAELMVVQGGEKILETTPIILMELLRKWSRAFGYHPNDVFALLERYGYCAWVFVEGGRLQACPQVTEETVQTNYIFMHPQKHAETIAQWQRPVR